MTSCYLRRCTAVTYRVFSEICFDESVVSLPKGRHCSWRKRKPKIGIAHLKLILCPSFLQLLCVKWEPHIKRQTQNLVQKIGNLSKPYLTTTWPRSPRSASVKPSLSIFTENKPYTRLSQVRSKFKNVVRFHHYFTECFITFRLKKGNVRVWSAYLSKVYPGFWRRNRRVGLPLPPG